MNQPIGNSLYGPLLIRLSLGAYFILAGLSKLDNLEGFVVEVKKLAILPEPFATLYGTLLPYIEIGGGSFLILGIWTTLAAIIISLLLASFVFAFGIFPNNTDLFNKDLILLAASLSLMYSGAGAFSIDQFRKTG